MSITTIKDVHDTVWTGYEVENHLIKKIEYSMIGLVWMATKRK